MLDEPCLWKCRCKKCVDDLNNVITKATLHQVKKYVSSSCQSAVFRYDSRGRLPLHVAASCGKVDVLSWLVSSTTQSQKGAEKLHIDAIDKESGWSALHRAVYYGRVPCVLYLLKNGANMWLHDKDGCNIFDMIVNDVSPWFDEPVSNRNSNSLVKNWTDLRKSESSEVFTWGTNENMTLGNAGAKSKSLPEVLLSFVKKNLSLKQVVMCKFHSIFVTHCGRVYSCGSARDGQLGCGKRDIFLEPQLIDFDSKVRCVAASTYHSVFVTANGQVWTCGLNHHHALGINPPPQHSVKPIQVASLKDHRIIGCAAGMYHSVAWSKNSLFTWGTNAGQLGHAKGDLFIDSPRKVPAFQGESKQFIDVHACNAATVIATTQGMVFLCHQYVCRKIVSRHMDVVKLQVGGGMLDDGVISKVRFVKAVKKLDKKQIEEANIVKILLLKSCGDVLSWMTCHETVDRCHFDTKQLRWVRDVTISTNGSTVMFTSVDGTAYFARYSSWYPGKKKTSSHKQEWFSSLQLLECNCIQMFKLDQVPCAFRTHSGVLGPKGSNAALLQCCPLNFLTEVPLVDPPNLNSDLFNFFRNTSETDLLHDVIFRIKRDGFADRIIAAHLFILASRSRVLSRLITTRHKQLKNCNQSVTRNCPDLVVENVYPDMFQDFIEFLYSGKIEVSENDILLSGDNLLDLGPPVIYWDGTERSKATKSSTSSKQKSKVKKLEMSRKSLLNQLITSLGVQNISYTATELKTETSDDETVTPVSIPPRHCSLEMSSLPHLYDCVIKCNTVSYSAHKCILAARIPYFSGMLFSPWVNLNKEITILKVPVPSDILRYVLDFAYLDSPSCLSRAKNIETRCEILAAADLLLMDRLKQVAEAQIVPLLTLKNVTSVIDVALAFNAPQLYNTCLQFMCHHFNALLQTPFFYDLDDDTLSKLEDVYRSNLLQAHMRAMPPCSDGPIIDHLPELEDDSVDVKKDTKQRKVVKAAPKRSKTDEGPPSLRKQSSTQSFGVLLSDLLKNTLKSDEDMILENIRKKHKVKPKIVESKPERENIEVPKAETEFEKPRKKRNKNKPVVRDANTLNQKETSNGTVPDLTPTESQPVATPVISPEQSYANYQLFFPELGVSPAQPTSTFSKPVPEKKSSLGDPPMNSGSSGIEIINVKKKSSKKEKRKAKDKPSQGKSAPIKIRQEKATAWGVPLKSPEEYTAVVSPLSPDRATSPLSTPSLPFAKPKSPQKQDGAWQSPPLPTYESPPTPQRVQRSDSVASSEPRPTMFMDILQDEIRNREHVEKMSKKSVSTIQLEETAMNELRLFYESSNRSDRIYFTVSRLNHATAREITDLRKALIRK